MELFSFKYCVWEEFFLILSMVLRILYWLEMPHYTRILNFQHKCTPFKIEKNCELNISGYWYDSRQTYHADILKINTMHLTLIIIEYHIRMD